MDSKQDCTLMFIIMAKKGFIDGGNDACAS